MAGSFSRFQRFSSILTLLFAFTFHYSFHYFQRYYFQACHAIAITRHFSAFFSFMKLPCQLRFLLQPIDAQICIRFSYMFHAFDKPICRFQLSSSHYYWHCFHWLHFISFIGHFASDIFAIFSCLWYAILLSFLPPSFLRHTYLADIIFISFILAAFFWFFHIIISDRFRHISRFHFFFIFALHFLFIFSSFRFK